MIFGNTSPIGTPDYSKVHEALPRAIEEAKAPVAKIVKSDFTREQPEQVSFQQLIRYHDRTPQITAAVSGYSELITGTDMEISSENEELKDFLDEWIRSTNFYDKFESLVNTVLICGNAILEKLDENKIEDVMEVDMSTIVSKKRDDHGMLEWYEHRTNNGQIAKLGEGTLGKFIEFNLTNVSRQAWGRSLFYSLAIPRAIGNRTQPPLIEIMWSIEDAMGAIYSNNAYPITTITYPGANDDYLKKEARRWHEYKPGDKRVQKIKPEIEFFEAQGSQSKYTEIIQHLEKAFELGTNFPVDIMTGDFTSRASSETTENLVMKKVRGFQRYLCNKLKQELFDPLLTQNGFDIENDKYTLGFTTQNVIELEVQQVKDFANSGIMTKNEARQWLRDNTGMELPDDDQIAQAEEDNREITMSKLNPPKEEKPNKTDEHIAELVRITEDNKKNTNELAEIDRLLKEIDNL